MSYDRISAGTSVRSRLDRFTFKHLLGLTLILVAATILLGVAARATGAGLACEANWPQCDAGPYNLFPANLPSFYEWIHRFVAMFAGFAIVGTAIAAWRNAKIDRLITSLVVAGMVLTPIQVVLGRETVLQYELTILSLHFWTAVLIFAIFVVATILVWVPAFTGGHVTLALAFGALTVPLHVALSPVIVSDITTYSPEIQTAQYGVTLALLTVGIFVPMVGRRRFNGNQFGALAFGVPVLALLVIVLGRRSVMTLAPVLDLLYVVVAIILFLTFLAGVLLARAR